MAKKTYLKQLKQITDAAEAAGWKSKDTKSGQMWLAPDGKGKVTIHGTPSDHRAIKNLRSEFRRAGLDV